MFKEDLTSCLAKKAQGWDDDIVIVSTVVKSNDYNDELNLILGLGYQIQKKKKKKKREGLGGYSTVAKIRDKNS